MSIPKYVFDFLTVALPNYPVSPFIRNHSVGFPASVYTFEGDDFQDPIPSITSPRLVRYDVMCLSRTLEESELMGELVIAKARLEVCPMRVTSVSRSYEPAYDGERQGIYIHTTSLEFFHQ